eukprot:SAG11_NODE_20769_length_438_cov_1.362832_1_plen_35_part_00
MRMMRSLAGRGRGRGDAALSIALTDSAECNSASS